jgi:PBSX family phage terminase large subunit
MQQTTALRKIASLKKKIWCIQGGQGAGKTIGILILLTNYASRNPNKEIYVASAELSKMRDTVLKDFIKILRSFNLYEKVNLTGVTNGQPLCIFPNKSFIRFIGLDKEDIGKGLRSDVVYLNEANKTNFETYRELTSRAKRKILDYNPNRRFWTHTEVIPDKDCEYLCLTFNDNEFLSEEERNEILSYKEKGYHNPDLENYDTDENTKSNYWRNKWRIYGLGMTGVVDNRIFENWERMSLKAFQDLPLQSYYGLDFGMSAPTALVEMKTDKDGTYYLNELLYKPLKEINGSLVDEFQKLKIPKHIEIICDSGNELNKEQGNKLRNAGYNVIFAQKGQGSVVSAIETMQKSKICYTETSLNLEENYENYQWKTHNGEVLEIPEETREDLIDASKYVIKWYSKTRGLSI